jgi:hypothetical protein
MPNKQETWAEPIKVSKLWALRVGSRDPSQKENPAALCSDF